MTPNPVAARPVARPCWLLLGAACLLVLGVTLYPVFLVTPLGQANHVATLLACWAISAGLVRGVGFIPQNRVGRWLLSPLAFMIACFGLLFLLFFPL